MKEKKGDIRLLDRDCCFSSGSRSSEIYSKQLSNRNSLLISLQKPRAEAVCDRKFKNLNKNGITYAKMHFAYIVPLSNRSVYFTYSLLLQLSLKIKSYCQIEIKKLRQVKVTFHQKVLLCILVN